jgi:hypothetical protein
MGFLFSGLRLNAGPALEVNDPDDHGDDQKDMDETAADVGKQEYVLGSQPDDQRHGLHTLALCPNLALPDDPLTGEN